MNNTEIDCKVAEMREWHLDEYEEEWLTSDGKWARDATDLHAIMTEGECWHPSTNIAQAMELIQEMNKDGWYLNFGQICEDDGSLTWYIEFDKYDLLEDENAPEEIQGKPYPHHYYDMDLYSDKGTTLEGIICLAYLKTKNKEV